MALFRTRGRARQNNLPQKYGNINSSITVRSHNAAGGSGNNKAYFAGGMKNVSEIIDANITNEYI